LAKITTMRLITARC